MKIRISIFRYPVLSWKAFLFLIAPWTVSIPVLGFVSLERGTEFNFHQYSINMGLSHSSVTTILQDKSGFMWIGTYDGLNRFDGMNFTTFKKDPDNSSSILNDRILSLYEDEDHRLWIGTEEGVAILNLKTFLFTIPDLGPGLDITQMEVRNIENVYKDEIWMLTSSHGLIRYSPGKGNPVRIEFSDLSGVNRPVLFDVEGITQNDFLFCTSLGLYVYNVESNEFTSIFDDSTQFFSRTVYKAGQTFFVGTDNGILELEYRGLRLHLKRHIFEDFLVESIKGDPAGNLWIATNRKGLIYGRRNGEDHIFFQYVNDPLKDNSLSTDRLSCIYSNLLGEIWVGTFEQGFNKADTRTSSITTIQNRLNPLISTSSTYVTCLSPAYDKKLFVGFRNGGLNLFDYETKQFSIIDFSNSFIGDRTFTKIFRDTFQNTWLLSWEGLLFLPPGKKMAEEILIGNPSQNQVACYCIVEDGWGRIWVGTRRGLFCILPGEDHSIDKILPIHRKLEELNDQCIQSLLYDPSADELWIGTQHTGLFILSLKKDFDKIGSDGYTHIRAGSDTTGIKSNYISCIIKSEKGEMYIGTEGGGLCRITRSGQDMAFRSFTEKDGLLNNVIKSILEDEKHQLWIGTNNGIFRFNTESFDFTSYTYMNGLQSNGFNYPAYKNEKGILFFGGINGFSYFHPAAILKDTSAPKVIFGDFYISYEKIDPGARLHKDILLPSALSYADTIYLRHNENNFSIEIIPIHYQNPMSNSIQYILENYDRNWINTNAYSNIASYSKIKPGKYVFKARAANSDGVWSSGFEELIIIVTPPLSKTKMAYLVYTILLILSIYLTYRITSRMARLRNEVRLKQLEKEKEQELNEAKLQFFTNISHEFKTPVSLIMGPVRWLLDRMKDNVEYHRKLELAHNQARYLLKLIDQLLEFRKVEKDRLRLKCYYMDIVEFVSNLMEPFSIYAGQKHITFELESAHDSIMIWFDPDKIEKVINNLLSNAFKFTPAGGIISVIVKNLFENNREKSLLIQVIDTGKGISADALPHVFDRFFQDSNALGGYGIGLSLSKYLVELHKGTIYAESEPGRGSTFFVELPHGDLHLSPEEKVSSGLRDFVKIDEIITDLQNTEVQKLELSKSWDHVVPEDKKTMLIVEDHHELRSFLVDLFSEDFRLLTAENGLEALEIVEKEHPDVIISDILMPEMNGEELCKELKSDINTCHIPIILLTSKDAPENRIKGLEIGADSYITKPFEIHHLNAQLKNLLHNRELLYEKFKSGIPLDLNMIKFNSLDNEFILKIKSIIESHIEDSDFDSNQFANKMFMNRTHFYRKMKDITNFTPAEFVRNYRMVKAAELLANERLNVSEVIYRVGFKNRSHFTRCFKEKYGMSPADFKLSLPG